MNDSISFLGLLEDEEIELDTAALALSALDHEGVPPDPYIDILKAITASLARQSGPTDTGEQQGAILARVIGGEFGFEGDRTSYDAPLNADMMRVIDRRRGLPVALSILYVAAARRLGWLADALNTPAHVLVSVGPLDNRIVIDPFNGGTRVMPDQIIALLQQALGPGAWTAAEHLAPMSNRMALVRLLLNQAKRAERAGDVARAAILYGRMTIIAPDNGQGWWDLARLQLSNGEVDEARYSLGAMLEVTRDPDRRRHITDTLEKFAGQ
jgi:regulator of sirC expression with transglutaminase-like and TPR domain